jgi:hypothetical protein
VEYRYGFLCDFAQEAGGKLTAVGLGINRLFAPEIPHTHPSLTLVVGVEYSVAEAGTKHLEVRLIDADGNDVLPQKIEGDTPFAEPDAGSGTVNVIVNFLGLKFEKYGDYAFHVTFDRTEIARLPLAVAAPPSTA